MKKSIRNKGAKIRMCASCGSRFHKDEADYIRIVLPKNGNPFIDRLGTASGRGAYVCHNKECVEKLCKSRRLSRSLRGNVSDALYSELRKEVGLDG
ncbi:MAG: YlxR family protein [Clostridia bacterium]|nr:YlxR family protein [Clostridia bacterium]